MSFFEEMASLCALEMKAARKAGDEERAAEVIATLTTLLGRSAAICAGGDPQKIDTLLDGCGNHALEEASSFAPMIELSASYRTPARKDPQERLRDAARIVREHLGVAFYDLAKAGEVDKAVAAGNRPVMDVLKELSGEQAPQNG